MPCLEQDAYHDDSSPWTLIADAVHADAVGDEDGLARGVFAHGVAHLSGHAARTVVLMSKRERGRRGGVAKGQGRCLTDIFVFRDFCNDHFRLARIDLGPRGKVL